MSLQGRVVFITGGGRGIGRAVALAMAGAGARVAVAARTEVQVEAVAAEVRALGVDALALACDVTSADAVGRAVGRTLEALGPVDVLVNNAGIAESALLTRTDDALWARTIGVNLTGTFFCMRAVLPSMIARGFGRIVNVASIAAKVGFPYTAAYCASKHGVLGLTRAAALEVATKGITVNAVCPGWVETDMTADSIARIVEKTGRPAADARLSLERMSPQHRLIQPEEVAHIVLMLASDAAHGITGQAINVDGGEVMA
ncbi:MAG: SDR family NAD(P)-dependent oxidoreductase [Vicinamibacterales bacterium]